jgi:hypothetical protein
LVKSPNTLLSATSKLDDLLELYWPSQRGEVSPSKHTCRISRMFWSSLVKSPNTQFLIQHKSLTTSSSCFDPVKLWLDRGSLMRWLSSTVWLSMLNVQLSSLPLYLVDRTKKPGWKGISGPHHTNDQKYNNKHLTVDILQHDSHTGTGTALQSCDGHSSLDWAYAVHLPGCSMFSLAWIWRCIIGIIIGRSDDW